MSDLVVTWNLSAQPCGTSLCRAESLRPASMLGNYGSWSGEPLVQILRDGDEAAGRLLLALLPRLSSGEGQEGGPFYCGSSRCIYALEGFHNPKAKNLWLSLKTSRHSPEKRLLTSSDTLLKGIPICFSVPQALREWKKEGALGCDKIP